MVSPEFLQRLAAYVPMPVTDMIYRRPGLLKESATRRRPAVVLFTDISGFTSLSELLGQAGPIGAEEITQLINAYFSFVVQTTRAYRGQIVKFSGDALTVLFPADQEPLSTAVRRAGECALTMQTRMSDFADLGTSRGLTSLSMKASIGAGEILECSVGGVMERWEYMVAGDPLVQVARAEHQAQSGEIILSQPAWAAAKDFFAGEIDENRPEIVKLVDVIESLPPSEPIVLDWSRLAPDQRELAARTLQCYVPGAIRSRLTDQPDWLAELRRTTVLFAGIGGFDYEAQDACRQVQDFVQAAQQVIYRFEGSLGRISVDDKGTVLLVLFGVPPFSHEDDAARAVACALALQTEAQKRNLRLSIGITEGPVFAGPIGAPGQWEYTVIGDEVNLAARLMQYGRSGATIISRRVMERAGPRFVTESLGELSLKGKINKLHAYLVNGEQGGQEEFVTRHLLHHDPFVNRKAELEQIRRLVTRARTGERQLLFIEGELGLGKSRLVSEMIREWLLAHGVGYGGKCPSYGRQMPYQVWCEVLRTIYDLRPALSPQRQLARLATAVAELDDPPGQQGFWANRLPLLADALGLDVPDNDFTGTISGQLRRNNTFALIEALLCRRIDDQPVLIVLEDVQWADELSLSLASSLAKSITDAPLLLVLVHRPISESGRSLLAEFKDIDHSHTITLEPLSSEASRDLIKILWGDGPLPEEMQDILLDRGQGNPFFLHELTHAALKAAEDQSLPASQLSAALDLPHTLQDVILARIDRLSEMERLTLKIASVIGPTFQRPLLEAVHPMRRAASLLPAQLERLEQEKLVSLEAPAPEWRYAFRNIMIQAVVYEGLLLIQRSQLHTAVGRALEKLAPDEVEPLAFHFNRGEDRAKAIHYLKIAGHKARREYANQAAISYYSEILDLMATPPHLYQNEPAPGGLISDDYWDILLERARLYNLVGNRDEELEDLGTLGLMAEALDDDRRRAMAAKQWSHLYETSGDYASSLELIERCVQWAHKAGDENLLGQGYNHWGKILFLCSNFEVAYDYLQQALMIAQSQDDKSAQADCLYNLGIVAHYQTDYEVALYFFQEVVEICRGLGDYVGLGKGLNQLGQVYYDMGQYTAALNYHDQSLVLHRSIGDREGEATSLHHLGQTYRTLGHYVPARKFLEQALPLHQAVGNRPGEAETLAHLGFLHCRLAEYDTAVTSLENALALAEELNDPRAETRTLTYLGWTLENMGEPQQAKKYFEKALKIRHQLQQEDAPMMQDIAHLGRVALTLGDFSLADACARRALNFVKSEGTHGIEHPAMVYLTCYHILQVNQKFERARAILAQGQHYLTSCVAAIDDPTLRQSYLINIPENRMLQELALSLPRIEAGGSGRTFLP